MYAARRSMQQLRTAHVEESRTALDEPDLLVVVQMPASPAKRSGQTLETYADALLEKALDLGLVEIAKTRLADVDRIAVLVLALARNLVRRAVLGRRQVPVQHTDLLQLLFGHAAARIVQQTLVAGDVIEVVCAHAYSWWYNEEEGKRRCDGPLRKQGALYVPSAISESHRT